MRIRRKNTQQINEMHTISIENSTIYIGESYLSLTNYLPDEQVILITDENVYMHYASFISQFEHIVIPVGEVVKTWQTVEMIVKQLLEKGADRQSFLVGMGGGVVTDITGFVASIFMRGISFGFVATSLLAQVDASLGGKNGINFSGYKNMLGVFNSPEFVICDANLLKTLPEREVRSGFGEIIKHALIQNASLFSYLQKNVSELLNLDAEKIAYVVGQAIEVKSTIVQADWKEKGERKKLNFGHTVGHAIENNSELTHGEAVAVGMYRAAQWSMKKGYLTQKECEAIKHLIESYRLPATHHVTSDLLASFIQRDKKKRGTAIDFVFLECIGAARIVAIPIKEIVEELES